MRIRKRFHLLSSLSSDPPVNNNQSSSIVQVQNNLPNLTSSDGQPTWVSEANDFILSTSSEVNLDLEVVEANDGNKIVEEEDGKEKKKKTSINDIIIRKECTLNEEVNISSLAPFSSPFDDTEGLVVPLKKRKRSYKRISAQDNDDNQYSKSEWKSETIKKRTMFQDDDNLHLLAKTTEVYVGDVIGNTSSSTSKRKKIRGSVLLEGSRCSRINGRGWRCCQPTLVGYSLCEHHLGKGRLRTMSTLRNQNQNQNQNHQKQPMGTSAIIISPKYNDGEQTQEQPSLFKGIINQEKIVGEGDNVNCYNNNDNDDELPRVIELKKMKKLGKVRARSMSSLLVAIDNATMIASKQPPKQ